MVTASTAPRLFEGRSSEKPSPLTISFGSNPASTLGVQLSSHDNDLTNEMFLPSHASVGRVLDGETLARRSGVRMGDCVVAVNGEGFRRFSPDFDDSELVDVTRGVDLLSAGDDVDAERVGAAGDDEERERKKRLKGRVISDNREGESYHLLLSRIQEVKASPDTPLVVSLERYAWDSRVHSWSRFLSARGGNVPKAMTMIQAHQRWRQEFFPVDLSDPPLRSVLRSRAVAIVDVGDEASRGGVSAAVYIDCAKLQCLARGTSTKGGAAGSSAAAIDALRAFVVHTEALLSAAPDPRRPRTCQFLDVSGVNLKRGLRADVLRTIYATFEANYPETLEKMVIYPVSKITASTVNVFLSFVNENTREKIRITDDLGVVCKELGWNRGEIESYGSVNAYMRKHLKDETSFVSD